MSLLCRIDWHNWEFGKPYTQTTVFAASATQPKYEETKWVQRMTCRRCKKVTIVDV